MRKSSLVIGVLRLPLDAILTIAAFFVAYELRRREIFPFDFLGIHLGEGTLDPLYDYLQFAGVATLILLVLLGLSGQYDLQQTRFRPLRQLIKIATIVSAWVMLIIAFFFLTRELFFSRAVLAYAWLLIIIFIFAGRVSIAFLDKVVMHVSRKRIKVLFIGAGKVSAKLASQLEKDPRYEVIGALVTDSADRRGAKLKVLGPFTDLEKVCDRYHPQEIFQIDSGLDKKQMGRLLSYCRQNQIDFRFIPPILEIHSKNIDIETVSGLPIVYLRPSRLRGWGRVVKRGLDIFGATCGIIVLSPILVLVAIGVKLSSPGPVFYLDYRVGRNRQKFICFKFRSMRTELCDGEITGTKEGNEMLEKLTKTSKNLRQGPLHKIEADPRRTKFGNFIRKTSLDELAQLWNVIRGEMSLVGPRPHMTKEVAKYKPHHNRVFAVKPGITGVAQISGRSDLDFDEEVRLDVTYIENWSLFLDIVIIIKTIPMMIIKRHRE